MIDPGQLPAVLTDARFEAVRDEHPIGSLRAICAGGRSPRSGLASRSWRAQRLLIGAELPA